MAVDGEQHPHLPMSARDSHCRLTGFVRREIARAIDTTGCGDAGHIMLLVRKAAGGIWEVVRGSGRHLGGGERQWEASGR